MNPTTDRWNWRGGCYRLERTETRRVSRSWWRWLLAFAATGYLMTIECMPRDYYPVERIDRVATGADG